MTTEIDNVTVVEAPAEAVQKLGAVEQWAADLVIATPDQYETAVSALKKIKALKTNIVEFFSDSKTKAHAAWKAIVANETGLTSRLDGAEKVAKAKMVAYQEAEEAKRLAEQRRLQAIADEKARKEREAAEAAARIQREKEAAARRAEEDARRKAEAARMAAAAEQDAIKRKALEIEAARQRAEAERKAKEASAAAARAEAKDERAATVLAPVIEVAQSAPKVGGTAMKKTWTAELLDLKQVIAAAAAGNDVAASFLSFNDSAAKAFARGTKGAIGCPGVRMFEVSGLSVSAK